MVSPMLGWMLGDGEAEIGARRSIIDGEPSQETGYTYRGFPTSPCTCEKSIGSALERSEGGAAGGVGERKFRGGCRSRGRNVLAGHLFTAATHCVGMSGRKSREMEIEGARRSAGG